MSTEADSDSLECEAIALTWDEVSKSTYECPRFSPGHEYKIVSQRGTYFGNAAFYPTHVNEGFIGLCVEARKYLWVNYQDLANSLSDKSTASHGDDMSNADGQFECQVYIRKTGP